MASNTVQIDMCFCPTCGRETEISRSPEWLMAHFTGTYANILSVLIEQRRKKQGISLRELIVRAYEMDKVKAPIGSPNTVQVRIKENQKKLNSLGWDILGSKTTGNGYWLVPLDRR